MNAYVTKPQSIRCLGSKTDILNMFWWNEMKASWMERCTLIGWLALGWCSYIPEIYGFHWISISTFFHVKGGKIWWNQFVNRIIISVNICKNITQSQKSNACEKCECDRLLGSNFSVMPSRDWKWGLKKIECIALKYKILQQECMACLLGWLTTTHKR